MGGVSGDAGEKVCRPGLGIDAIHLGRDNETVHGSCPMAAPIRPAEQPGFSAESNTAQSAFGGIVREADTPIFEEQGEGGPALENVVDRLDQVVAPREPSELRAHIGMEIVDQGAAQRMARGQALLGALAVDRSLDREQRVDTAHYFDRDRR